MSEHNGTEKNGRQSWVLPTIGVLGVIIGAAVTFFVNVTSIGTRVTANEARIAALEDKQSSLSERQTIIRGNVIELSARISELETQICAQDDVRNAMQSANLRALAILWQKVGETAFPQGDAFYPQVCHRTTTEITK
jgi:hypothetical protein